MPSGKSSKTVVVGFRLPLDVYEVLQRRVNGRATHWGSVAEYLQERIIYDVRRVHTKGKSSQINNPDPDFWKRKMGGRYDEKKRKEIKQRGQV